jgi:hypothetical protein
VTEPAPQYVAAEPIDPTPVLSPLCTMSAGDRRVVRVQRADGLNTTWRLQLADEWGDPVDTVELVQWQRDLLVAALGAPPAERCSSCVAAARRVAWFATELAAMQASAWRHRQVVPPMCRRPAALEVKRRCRSCGCTDLAACDTDGLFDEAPCWWVKPDLCSSCYGQEDARG